ATSMDASAMASGTSVARERASPIAASRTSSSTSFGIRSARSTFSYASASSSAMGRRRALSASAWAAAPAASSHCSFEKRAAIAASEAPIAPTTAATEPPPGAEVSAEMVSQNSPTLSLEKSNGAAILVDVDVEGRWGDAVARHRLHVAEERYEPAGPRVLANVADGDGEARRRVQQRGVVGEREVCL